MKYNGQYVAYINGIQETVYEHKVASITEIQQTVCEQHINAHLTF